MDSIFLIILIIIAFFALISSVRIVKQYEKGIVIRLGKFKNLVDSGVAFVFPFIESIITVDMREKLIEVQPQKVITKDNVSVVVDAVIYYKVVDPVKAEFEVQDFAWAATTLAQTNLRNLIGDKLLDETLVARDLINTNLRDVLDEATQGWGVKVTRVEVQKIDPPEDITNAMSRQMKAEREKRASILESEGIKQSQILEAQGLAEAQILKADAEAKSIQKVAEASEKFFTEKAQLMKRLEVSEKVFASGTKWVIPANADLVNVLNLGEDKIIPIKK